MSQVPPAPALSKGCVVHCRSHHHLVEEVWPPEEDGRDTVVRLACLDDDANGQITEVFWEREVDAQVGAGASTPGPPTPGSSSAIRWCGTRTTPGPYVIGWGIEKGRC